LTLEAWEEFILSIILVLIVLGVIIIAYYNLALAIRGHAPFKVHLLLPQIMFPRGVIGLGKHNIEDETSSGAA
jgi:L-asparagine transporter-like permease